MPPPSGGGGSVVDAEAAGATFFVCDLERPNRRPVAPAPSVGLDAAPAALFSGGSGDPVGDATQTCRAM